MNNKIEIITSIGIIIAVILTTLFFINNMGTITIDKILLILIPILLISAAAFLIWDRLKNVRKGLPAADERLKVIGYKASYYGFIAAIWSAVGAPLFYGIVLDYELTGHESSAVVVLISGLTFILSYLILARRG